MRFLKLLSLAFLFTIIFNFLIYAQDCKVKNVNFKQQGDNIIIRYDLQGRANKTYKVSLFLSDNGGISYRIKPRSVKGDVGSKVKPGSGKKIIWLMSKDYPDGLEGDRFVFAVDAELKKASKLPVFLLSAGAVGGTVYLVLKMTEPKTGTIKLNISDY